MSVTKLFTLHTIVIGVGGTPVQINQLKSKTISPQLTRYFEYGSGVVDPQFAAYDGESPVVMFTATCLKKVLDAIDIDDGRAIATGNTCDLYFQQMAKGSTRQTGLTARKISVGNGLACISRIAASDGEAALITGMIYATSSDGETSPLAYAINQTVPTLDATDELYTVGPALFNNVGVESVQSILYEPKIDVQVRRDSGQPYPTFAYINRRGSEGSPSSISLVTKQIDGLANTVTPISAATQVSFRSYKAGAFRETLAAAKHVTIACAAGGIATEGIESADGTEASMSVEINGTGSPAFVVTTDDALA